MTAAHVPIGDLMGPGEQATSRRRSTARRAWTFVLLRAVCVALLSWFAASLLWTIGPMALGLSPTLVMSGSMAPKIDTGDVVLTGPVTQDGPGRVRPGAVVVAENPAQPGTDLLHRVTRVKGGEVHTKGDANPSEDSTPIARDDVDGVGRLLVPFVGRAVVWAVEGQLVWVALSGAALVALIAAAAARGSGTVAITTAVTALALTAATVLGANGASAAWSGSETRAPSAVRAWEYPAQQAMWQGSNASGQGGGSDVVADRSPAQVTSPAATGWSATSTQEDNSCSIRASSLYCIGAGYYSSFRSTKQGAPADTPQLVGNGVNWTAITTGKDFFCGLRATALNCWGLGTSGQLGLGNTSTQQQPTQVGSAGWNAVSAGDAFACGIQTNLGLYCWGLGSEGQLGQGDTASSSSPVRVGTDTWTAVAAGAQHVCAIKVNGSMWCWGYNAAGQLGQNAVTARSTTPVQVFGNLTTWNGVVAGTFHTCMTRSDSPGVFCMGGNNAGQLGDGTNNARATPGAVSGLSGTFSQLGAGHHNSCAIRNDNAMWCWGDNTQGQVGDGTLTNRLSPIQIGDGGWASVRTGGQHTCAVTVSPGQLWCWGKNHLGQLGVGRPGLLTSADPLPVTPAASPWVAISGGTSHACGVRQDRSLWCWGANGSGQLGQGDLKDRGSPARVGSANDWLRVSAGSASTCATRSDTTLWCWGSGGDHRLGVGDTGTRTSPDKVTGTGWATVSMGTATGCATKTDSTLWCWGSNQNGTVGNGLSGAANNAPTPVQLIGTGWANASNGGNTACATKYNRTLYCWGFGTNGAIGDGASTQRTTPTQVTGTAWERVTTGGSAVCATKTDKSLWCWGGNADGQVGRGNTTNASSPVQVSSWTDVTSVALGLSHTCAARASGAVYCWGANTSGQLGIGAVVGTGDVLSPNLTNPAARGARVYAGDLTTYTISPTQSFEAEQSVLGGSFSGSNSIAPTVRTTASGGRSVGGHFSGNSMTWTVNAPAAGSYTVRVFYASQGSPPQTQNLVVNGASQMLTYPNSGDFQTFRPAQNQSVTATANLTSGQNTVVLSSTGDIFFEIDRITLTPN